MGSRQKFPGPNYAFAVKVPHICQRAYNQSAIIVPLTTRAMFTAYSTTSLLPFIHWLILLKQSYTLISARMVLGRLRINAARGNPSDSDRSLEHMRLLSIVAANVFPFSGCRHLKARRAFHGFLQIYPQPMPPGWTLCKLRSRRNFYPIRGTSPLRS